MRLTDMSTGKLCDLVDSQALAGNLQGGPWFLRVQGGFDALSKATYMRRRAHLVEFIQILGRRALVSPILILCRLYHHERAASEGR